MTAQDQAKRAPGPFSGVLPPEVLTEDFKAWVPPTQAQVRLIVGLRSLTGVPAWKAAELIGVTEQTFRRFNANPGVKTSNSMTYAQWHLLLHRLNVQAATVHTK